MAGIVKDEGAGLDYLINSMNVTDEDFLSYATKAVAYMKTNISAESIRDFYLSGVDRNDTEAIKAKIFDFAGDIVIKCPTYHMAKQYALHSKDKSKVFFYELTRAPVIPKSNPLGLNAEDIKRLGAVHAIDNLYVFGAPYIIKGWEDKVDFEFTKQYMKYWTDFAKYG